jgi:hypothetical protein
MLFKYALKLFHCVWPADNEQRKEESEATRIDEDNGGGEIFINE